MKEKWQPFTPTFTSRGSKVSPTDPFTTYYWSGWHIVTTVNEYKREGKTVKFHMGYKRLSLWGTLKFWIRSKFHKPSPLL